MIVGTAGRNDERGNVQGMLMGINLNPAQTIGKQLWKINFDEPYSPTTANATNTLIEVFPESNTFVCGMVGMQGGTKTLVYYGYDLTTGKQIWQTDPMQQFDYYNSRLDTYKGLLFLDEGYGGVIEAYNLTTGKQAWNYTAQNFDLESPYGNYPLGISCIADENGLIYLTGSEHSPTQPLWRGPNLRCINATDGTEVWSTLFWGANMGPTDPSNVALSDGILVGLNFFDNELYAFGKGPSATTVSAPQSSAIVGSVLTITGTVTDQTSSGRRNSNDLYDFTLKGTPAISDASMKPWMEYLFQQQAKPTNATGVPVSLHAIDPNGNYIPIGDVTSDMTGAYGCAFTPQVPGTYQIVATFAGSNAYGTSSAQTYMAVGEPATTSIPTPTTQAQSVADAYFIPAIAGLFVLVIVVLALVALSIVRKR
jgi:outer membrane protein assembly factor BamB